MNKAIDKARGEWIYFLGADDYLLSADVFSFVFPVLKNCSDSICYGRAYLEPLKMMRGSLYDWENLLELNICHQAIFYRKHLFQKLGNFNLKYKAYADWDFNIRCKLAGESARFLDIPIAHYSDGGLSINGDLPFYRDFCFNLARYRFRYSKGTSKILSFPMLLKEQIILWNKKLIDHF